MIDPSDDLALNRAVWTVVNTDFTDGRSLKAFSLQVLGKIRFN